MGPAAQAAATTDASRTRFMGLLPCVFGRNRSLRPRGKSMNAYCCVCTDASDVAVGNRRHGMGNLPAPAASLRIGRRGSMSAKSLLALAAGAGLLAGCVADPYYYDRYAYDDSRYYDRPVERYYDYGPAYYGPAYYPGPYIAAPSVGFGITYSSRHRGR